jgi:hypothetical protein
MNDLPVVRLVDEAPRLVQAFQFTVSGFSSIRGLEVLRCRSADEDEHGGVCPVNLQEGGKTILGDPIESGLLCCG